MYDIDTYYILNNMSLANIVIIIIITTLGLLPI